MSTMSCFWQRRSLVPVEEGTIAFFPFRARDLWLGMLSAAVSPPPIEPYPRSRAAIRLLPAEIFSAPAGHDAGEMPMQRRKVSMGGVCAGLTRWVRPYPGALPRRRRG
jgi:hypothetical protein